MNQTKPNKESRKAFEVIQNSKKHIKTHTLYSIFHMQEEYYKKAMCLFDIM